MSPVITGGSVQAQDQRGVFEEGTSSLTELTRQRPEFRETKVDRIYGAEYQGGGSCLQRGFPAFAEERHSAFIRACVCMG